MMKTTQDNNERPFSERRRQQFLTEEFAVYELAHCKKMAEAFELQMVADDTDEEGASLLTASMADNSFEWLSLSYTAGNPIEPLRGDLEVVAAAYERYAQSLRTYENEPRFPAFGFQEIADFERLAQLLGLCYLLHRRDLIPRLHALIAESAYDGEDAVYEELVGHVLPDRPYLENWYHKQPYLHLLNATDKTEPADKTSELIAYCEAWYPAMADAPWHDGHKRIQGTEGDYFGYWAFEAGAIALLYDIDDRAIDHLVYPKDLVAWARANKHLSEEPSDVIPHGRCEAGQPCPRSGFWFTPAQAGSRRFFKVGEVMPSVDGDYGATIWQWDRNQDEPQL